MMLREAVFLFSGTTVRLNDIPPGGVGIRLLGSRHGKCVYRVTVQTRFQGSYDFAVNVNHSLTKEQVQEEMQWLILSGASQVRDPLVEDFGGYWDDQDLWTEEFVPGETLDRALRRLSRQKDVEERFPQLWPFFVWSALSAYVDFWNRTGRRWEISDPSMANVIVPTHDYQTGARIVSVSSRRPHAGLIAMMRSFRENLVRAAEREYPILEDIVDWDVIFSSVLEILGEEEGLRAILAALQSEGDAVPQDLKEALWRYVGAIEARGFLPMRLLFAAKRYRRWAALSAEPTPQARAQTLQELYDTYGLRRLAASYPETRVRFFRETVFRDAQKPLVEGLDVLIGRLRRGEMVGDDLTDAVADVRAKLELGPDEDYFLARLSFPYLRPEDAAGFVRTDLGGRRQTEIVVTLEDEEETPFQVRHALNPKEVGRLHRLFLAAKLDVFFRPEHQYLVALNERGQIIGGIYYEMEEGGKSAHMDKIVVAERFRKKGVADGLMRELFNRLRATGVKTVTTGFFRPEFFYAYGFAIEKRYAGLVKSLE
jgi:GNAT superfamily N-acetyltransferase